MQLPKNIVHEGKLHFISYKSVSLFSKSNVYTQNFEHLNKIGVRATMDSKLEEQISVIQFLQPCHIFQSLQKSFSKACISSSTFYSWVSQFREGRTSMRDKPRPGRPAETVTPSVVANVEVFVNKDGRVAL